MLGRWREAGLVGPTVAALVAFAILAGLGTWQMQRKAWKEGLIAQIQARVKAEPNMLEQLSPIAKLSDAWFEYTRLAVRGRLLHARELHFYAPDRSGPGYHVVTPLELSDGRIVFVNRGWVPELLKEPARRAVGQVDGTVEVVGLLRVPTARPAFAPDNDPARNIWHWRDPAGMRQAAFGSERREVMPFIIEAEASPPNPGGWPRGGVTRLELSNRHLEYALTWYGLAAALVGVFTAFAAGRLRRR